MIAEAISSVANFFKEVFSWGRERQALNNTAAMQQNAEAKAEAKAQDAEKKAVAERDAEAIRKGLSLLLILGLFTAGGCLFGTVQRAPVQASQIGFDGNNQNAGFYGYATNANGISGILSFNAVRKYNNLAEVYGSRNNPPIKPWEGLTPYTVGPSNFYLIDDEHLTYFLRMERWRAEELKKP